MADSLVSCLDLSRVRLACDLSGAVFCDHVSYLYRYTSG